MAGKSLLTNHGVNRSLTNIIKLVDDQDFQARLEGIEPTVLSIVRSAESFSRQLKDQVQNSSDSEVSISGLNQVRSNLDNVFNQLNGFKNSGNVANLNAAGGSLDGALAVAAWAFHSRATKQSKRYGETIGSVRKAAGQAIKAIEAERDTAMQKVEALEMRVDEQDRALNDANDQLEQIRSSSNTRLDEITADFAKIQTSFEKSNTSEIQDTADRLKDFFEDKTKQASAKTSEILGHEKKAREILQIVGNIGLTGNYQNRATSERKSANWLRGGAVVFFVATAGVLGLSVFESFDRSVGTFELITRAIVAVIISAPALYLAKESARHRTNSDAAKQTELELASLSPFLESLPTERRQEVIEALANSYFGGNVADHKVNHPLEITTEQLTKLLLKILENGKA